MFKVKILSIMLILLLITACSEKTTITDIEEDITDEIDLHLDDLDSIGSISIDSLVNDTSINENDSSTAEEIIEEIIDDTITVVHEDSSDYSYDEYDMTTITMANSGITVEGPGATVASNVVTIDSYGTYKVIGTIDDGQLAVNVTSIADSVVNIILSNVSIAYSKNSPIYIEQASKTVIELAENTINTLSDATSYTDVDATTMEPDAALFSKDDLTLYGTGKLVVNANFKDGIVSKDGLLIKDGEYVITAVDDGIRGKNYLAIDGGDFVIETDGDGLKSTNSAAGEGYIKITSGKFNISTGRDGIQASNNVLVDGGTFEINSGLTVTDTTQSGKAIVANSNVIITGGDFVVESLKDDGLHCDSIMILKNLNLNIESLDEAIRSELVLTIGSGNINITKSDKGLESMYLTVNGGDLTINTTNDAIHSDQDIYINGGNITINSDKNDGLHADSILEISDGTITVESSLEGIEANNITIKNGTINIRSTNDAINADTDILIENGEINIYSESDDGIHADSTIVINNGSIIIENSYEGVETHILTINGGYINVTATDDGVNVANSDALDPGIMPDENGSALNWFYFNGGTLVVTIIGNGEGDGVDVNGSIIMEGGIMLVSQYNDKNGALDYDYDFEINGGVIIAAGAGGGNENGKQATEGTINSVSITLEQSQSANTLFNVQNKAGTEIITFSPSRDYQNVVVATAALTNGDYVYYYGGSHSGDNNDGYYTNGTYTPGTGMTEFSINSQLTTVGSTSTGGPGGR